MTHLQVSESLFVYVLGVVVVASRPDHFLLGMMLAGVPIVLALIQRLTTRRRYRTATLGHRRRER